MRFRKYNKKNLMYQWNLSQLDQYTTSQPSLQILFSLLLTTDMNRYNFWSTVPCLSNKKARGKQICSSNQKMFKKNPGTLPGSQSSCCTLGSNPAWSSLQKRGLLAGLILVVFPFGKSSTFEMLKSSLHFCASPFFLGPLDGSSPFTNEGSCYLFAPAQQLCQAQ